MVEENEAQKGNSSKIIELESGGAGIQTQIQVHKHEAVPYEFKIQLCLLKYFGLLWIISSVGKRAERTSDPSDSSIQPPCKQPGGDVPGF